MRIFLIAGKARSGKYSVAESIKNYYDQNNEKTVLTEFSKYIKLFASEMIDWEYNKEPKPRRFLQNMGSFIRINLQDPDFFIRRMQEDIKIYEKFFDNLVIADVRFPKEILKMKENYQECYSIYVVNEHGNYDLNLEESKHETERALDDFDDFDYIIVNDDKKALNKKMHDILKEL
ncbi:MAG: hypothetical protein HFI09_03615 [Bacilli bacterium]|nr:hypothetical protein [Bacilli bacterium]